MLVSFFHEITDKLIVSTSEVVLVNITCFMTYMQEDAWCFGWMNSGIQSKDGKDMTLLGGTANYY